MDEDEVDGGGGGLRSRFAVAVRCDEEGLDGKRVEG